VVAVGLDSVGDADHHRDQADGEGDISEPVDPRRATRGEVAQLRVGPERAEHAERHRDQEHQSPLHRGEQAAEDQAEKGAGDCGDAVDAQRETALVLREGVGDDRARVGEQQRSADALADAHEDEPQRTGATAQPRRRERQREQRENGEAEVVHADTPVHVAEPSEAHHQHGGDHEKAEDHPQQVVGVARRERVDVDAAEDVRQRDQEDRGVDRREQHADGRVGEHDPLVVGAGCARG
jgi:hypothetical protein